MLHSAGPWKQQDNLIDLELFFFFFFQNVNHEVDLKLIRRVDSGRHGLFGCCVHFCSRALFIEPSSCFLLFWLWPWSRSTLPGSSENTTVLQVGRRDNVYLQTQLLVQNAHSVTSRLETSVANKPWGSGFFSFLTGKQGREVTYSKNTILTSVCLSRSVRLAFLQRARSLFSGGVQCYSTTWSLAESGITAWLDHV